MGYGRTDAADGRIFKWVFNFPTTYWSQASAFVRYVGEEEGGLDKLAGTSIALLYHNSAYGKEPIPVLKALSAKYGFKLRLVAVDHPGQEQKAAWLQIRRHKPDWIFLWGFGVMNQVALKEAAAGNFPMDRMLGVWWAGTESDVVPAGDKAIGYKAGTFHAPGSDFPLFQDIVKYVYDGDFEEARRNHWGEVLYNRVILNNVYTREAMLTAMDRDRNQTDAPFVFAVHEFLLCKINTIGFDDADGGKDTITGGQFNDVLFGGGGDDSRAVMNRYLASDA